MPLFYYETVKTKSSLFRKKRAEVIEAASLLDAKERLREKNILVTTLSASPSSTLWKKKQEISKRQLLAFTLQLKELLSASLPLYESLLSLEEQYRTESIHPIIVKLAEEIKGGASLSVALSKFPASFSKLYIAIVRAGESVGALDAALEKLTTLLTKEQKMKKQILSSLLYPAILLSFACLVIAVLLIFVIPSLETIFEDRNVNRFTLLVIGVSHFVREQWFFYLPLIGAMVIGLGRLCKKESVRLWLYTQTLKIPLLKSLMVEIALARFARTLSSLLKGGVPMIEALRFSREVMHHPLLEKIIFDAEKKIVEGSSLSKQLKGVSFIPPLVPRLLQIGEEGGKIQEMLLKLAELYEDEVEKKIARLLTLAQPAIMLLMGAIVGAIMMSVLLPLTDVNAFMEGT